VYTYSLYAYDEKSRESSFSHQSVEGRADSERRAREVTVESSREVTRSCDRNGALLSSCQVPSFVFSAGLPAASPIQHYLIAMRNALASTKKPYTGAPLGCRSASDAPLLDLRDSNTFYTCRRAGTRPFDGRACLLHIPREMCAPRRRLALARAAAPRKSMLA
jgi:hypothetical protein